MLGLPGVFGVSGVLALVAIVAVAMVVRSVGLDLVFLDDGDVVFTLGDALYHAHRARFSLANFPDFLTFDSCLNHPHGSSVPYPPLFDLLVAGVARALGGSHATFERVAAWLPALLGSLAVLPTFAVGRRLGGVGVGLGAAALLALSPVAIIYSRVGYADHHAAVGLLGALLVAGYASVLDTRTRGRARAWAFVGLALTRSALLVTWQGALLYLFVGEVALTAVAALRDRRDLFRGQIASALAVIVLVAPFVAKSATPVAGPWSAAELSRLHLLFFACEALVLAALVCWEHARPAPDARARGLRLLAVVSIVALGVVLVPGVRDGLAPAFGFLAQRDEVGSAIPEQAPLFSTGAESGLAVGMSRMGLFALLVPLAPLAFLVRSRVPGISDACRYLFAWSVVIGVLAIQQVRYANDLAPVASVAFALLLALAAERLRDRGWSAATAAGAAVVGGGLLLAPASPAIFGTSGLETLRHLVGGAGDGDRALLTVRGTQHRFAQAVRAATPDTPGCDGTGARPDYAILSPLSLGHALHYVAGRATPADNFGPYIGWDNFRNVRRFFAAQSEGEALAVARDLGVEWVVTEEEGEEMLSSVGRRLHREGGNARPGRPAWGHFRLVTEGPAGGLPTAVLFGSPYLTTPPFKLFRIVRGAQIEVTAPPGTIVEARVALESPSGRRFPFRALATADDDGVARLRVPYPTESSTEPAAAAGRVRALAPYRVSAEERTWRVALSEAQVAGGARVRLSPPADAP